MLAIIRKSFGMRECRPAQAVIPVPGRSPLEHFPTKWNQFDGGKSVFRAGAARSAMQRIGRGSQRTRGTDVPRDTRLTTTQNHPGQMVPFGRKML
jgi:hypothetical protein